MKAMSIFSGKMCEWIKSQTFAGLWTESISINREFTINDEVLSSHDSLLHAIWKANWGKEPPPHASFLPDEIHRKPETVSKYF
ncbi:MAG: hypothetical protein AYK18_05395 [Theionarchaea archaeon DG-70]|nr:MAG: hypothetical protein AYK18_05395 [Theionarchaea archaeon DG-70]